MSAKKQGILRRLFGKQQSEPNPPDTGKAQSEYDYSVLPELAKILSNGNEQAASDMRALSENVGAFVRLHQEWCDEMDYGGFGAKDEERQEESLLVLAYWLAGYAATDDPRKAPRQFGAYIDWKEETGDIVWKLGNADKNLCYGLCLDEIAFDEAEFTDKALKKIDGFLSGRGLALCALDTQSDSYHLFVLRDEEFGSLKRLAGRVGFRFYREFA